MIATQVGGRSQGGVTLCWKESERFIVEEQCTRGANIITCQLVTGKGRYCVIGCYISPHDTATVDDIEKAIHECLRGCIPMLMGDLNINFEDPRDARDDKVTEILDAQNFFDTSRCFRQHRAYNLKGR